MRDVRDHAILTFDRQIRVKVLIVTRHVGIVISKIVYGRFGKVHPRLVIPENWFEDQREVFGRQV